MLGYVRNAGTCKMVYDSVPYLPLTPLATPFSTSPSSLIQFCLKDKWLKIPGHLLRRRVDFALDIVVFVAVAFVVVVVVILVVVVVVELHQVFGLHSIIFEFQQQANK